MKIIAVQNGWSGQGISGGDKHLLDVAGIWQKQNEIIFVLPRLGWRFLVENFSELTTGFKFVSRNDFPNVAKLKSLSALLFYYGQRAVWAVLAVLRLGRADWVLSSSHFFYDVLPAVVLKRCRRTPWAVYVYHLISDQKRTSSQRNRLSVIFERGSLFLIKKYADVVFTDNPETLKNLAARGISLNRLHLTSVGVPQAKPATFIAKEYALVFTGRLVWAKGVYDIIETVDELSQEFPELKLALVGTGDEEVNLKKLVAAKNLKDRVIFWGFISEAKKIEVLQRSRIFISPSLEEGWGISLAEALSYGLPAVVYDLPVLRQIFGGAPCFVALSDRRALTSMVRQLLTNADFYAQKSRQALSAVADLTVDKVAPQELSVLLNYAQNQPKI